MVMLAMFTPSGGPGTQPTRRLRCNQVTSRTARIRRFSHSTHALIESPIRLGIMRSQAERSAMVPALQGRRFPEQRVRTDPGRWREALEAGRRPPLPPEPWQDHRLRDEDGRIVRMEAHEVRAAEFGLHVEGLA